MSSGDRRIIVYGTDSSEVGDVDELRASLRMAFPECAVDVVDHLRPTAPDERSVPAEEHKAVDWLPPECIYVVLGWLGGTVAKPIVEAAAEAAISAIKKWWRNRNGTTAAEESLTAP